VHAVFVDIHQLSLGAQVLDIFHIFKRNSYLWKLSDSKLQQVPGGVRISVGRWRMPCKHSAYGLEEGRDRSRCSGCRQGTTSPH